MSLRCALEAARHGLGDQVDRDIRAPDLAGPGRSGPITVEPPASGLPFFLRARLTGFCRLCAALAMRTHRCAGKQNRPCPHESRILVSHPCGNARTVTVKIRRTERNWGTE